MLPIKILAMLGAFIVLSAIGFGPAAMLTSSCYKRRLLVSAALSPVIGFILVALVLNSLFVLDITIRTSAITVTLIGLISSAVFVYWDWKRRSEDYRSGLHGISRLKLGLVLGAFVVTIGLLLLPAGIGGEAYQYYQGSGHDAVNYMLMARYAIDTPASYVGNPSDYQGVVNQNPAVSVVMVATARLRPSVAHILAWNSVLFNQSPFDLFYFNKLLHYLIAFCVALAIGYVVGLPILYILGMALVSGTGFWVLMVGDIDAYSQSSVIPIGLLVVFALIQFERDDYIRLLSCSRVLLAISLAGMLSFYPESFTLLLTTLALYYGLSWLLAPSWSRAKVILSHIVTVIFALMLQNVALFDTFKFWFSQSSSIVAAGASWNVWVEAAYKWLLRGREFFISSLWGLISFRREEGQLTTTGIASATLVLGLASAMVIIIGAGFYKALLNLKAEIAPRVIACILLVYWGGASLLYMVGLEGIGGKAFAMGAPFMILAVFIFVQYYFKPNNITNRLIHIALIVWVGLQMLTFPLRAGFALEKVDLPLNYITAVKKTEFTQLVIPVVDTLAKQASGVVGTDFGGRRYPFYYVLLGRLADYHTVLSMENLSNAYDIQVPDNYPSWHVNLDKIPNYMILSADRDYLGPIGVGTLLQKNDAFYYYQPTEHVVVYTIQPADFQTALYRADILNPDVPTAFTLIQGFESIFLQRTGGSFARWMNGETAEMRFISSSTEPLGVYMESTALNDGKLNITFNDMPVNSFAMQDLRQTRQSVCITPKTGINFLKFDPQPNSPNPAKPSRLLLQKLLFAPIDSLDVGALSDNSQIGTGWQAQETWKEDTIRWAEKTANLQLMTCETTSGRTLHFKAFVPAEIAAQEVTVQMHDKALGVVQLHSGWDEYEIPIPMGALSVSGLQSIQLIHSQTFVPSNDTRVLAAAYDRFWLTSDSSK